MNLEFLGSRVQGLGSRVFEKPSFFKGLAFRVCCNFLILDFGDLMLQVNLRQKLKCSYVNEIPKIVHLVSQKLDSS